MALIRIAKLDEITPGQPHPVHPFGQNLVLCRVEDQVYAVYGLCPHSGGPLGQGALHGRMLVCPWHAWEFDCTTGEYDRNPACRLKTYPVTIHNGDVLVELPDA